MGLLDMAVGALAGGNNQGGGGLQNLALQAVTGLLQNHQGGLGGLVASLAQSGLQQQVQSWVGTGPNLSVEPSALASALGSGVMGNLAQQIGVAPDQAASLLSSVLPTVVDKLTPNGTIEPSQDLMSQGVSMLGGLFGNK